MRIDSNNTSDRFFIMSEFFLNRIFRKIEFAYNESRFRVAILVHICVQMMEYTYGNVKQKLATLSHL